MTAVVDASAIGSYILADEQRHLLPGLAEVLADGVTVPPHWHVEVANLLLIACRRGRLDEAGRRQAQETLATVAVKVDSRSADEVLSRSWELAEAHRLTIYDASYLELAQRAELPLATNDSALIRAAAAENLMLFGR